MAEGQMSGERRSRKGSGGAERGGEKEYTQVADMQHGPVRYHRDNAAEDDARA